MINLALNILPDGIIRFAIKRLLKKRLLELNLGSHEEIQRYKQAFMNNLRDQPIAMNTSEANEQHYEVPPEFYELVLGGHLKYSCCFWNEVTQSLTEAEEEMLSLTVKRSACMDGDRILELGCGWGSLTLYLARSFPHSNIVAVSNSKSQKNYILKLAAERSLNNIEVITADMNTFEAEGQFDRVVSIEMFEHMRNYKVLLQKISSWMKAEATLFVHIFTHSQMPYLFEIKDQSDWMARYFFTGGMMPSRDIFSFFDDHLRVLEQWHLSGDHYSKTARAWLNRMDFHRDTIRAIFDKVYQKQSKQFFNFWRVFFMACEETFNYKNGEEWGVSHYLLKKT